MILQRPSVLECAGAKVGLLHRFILDLFVATSQICDHLPPVLWLDYKVATHPAVAANAFRSKRLSRSSGAQQFSLQLFSAVLQ